MNFNSGREETVINHQSSIINPMGPEEQARVLKKRARALAGKTAGAEGHGGYMQVVEFLLVRERYALELPHIREVYPLKDLTPLPGTPDFVLGIINVRGEILSIIDMKRFFDLPERKGLTPMNQVIILESDEMAFGILADEILGTRSVPMSAIQKSLPTLTGIRAEYLLGVTGEGIVILDGTRILSDNSLLVQ